MKSVVIKNKFSYIFLVESFLVESTVTLVESFLVESTVVTLVESTLVESVVLDASAPFLQAAKEAIARTNNNFFIF